MLLRGQNQPILQEYNENTVKDKVPIWKDKPSHIWYHLISAKVAAHEVVRSQEIQTKTIKTNKQRKAVRTFMYFKLDESLAHTSLNSFGISKATAKEYLNSAGRRVNETHV